MAHTIITRNRALHIIDAECDRMHMPAYTDVAYALRELLSSAEMHEPPMRAAIAEAQRILNAIKGETE